MKSLTSWKILSWSNEFRSKPFTFFKNTGRKETKISCCTCLGAYTLAGNGLLSTLASTGVFYNAEAFDKTVHKKKHDFISLIRDLVKCGKPEEALTLYRNMENESSHSCEHTLLGLLKACVKLKDLERSLQIHVDIARMDFLSTNIFLGSALVDMHGKCGSLARAREVFDQLLERNVVSWTAIINGNVEHGYAEEALVYYERMQVEGMFPNSVTHICCLKACTITQDTLKGHRIHIEAEIQGILQTNHSLGNALLDMYGRSSSLDLAQTVFDKLLGRDVISWTALISAYTEHGHEEEAIKSFEAMQLHGIFPDSHTFVCVLKACSNIGVRVRDIGIKIHDEIERRDLISMNPLLCSSLINMYTKCGMFRNAKEVFDKVKVRNVVPYNALISCYTEHGQSEEAWQIFNQMQFEGVSSNAVTLICMLKACCDILDADNGREIHAEIERKGYLETHSAVGNALIDMYGKSGLVTLAQEVFDKFVLRDVVSWNALMSANIEHGFSKNALKCYKDMQHEGISPDSVSYVCILKACGSLGAVNEGQMLHAEIERLGLLETDVVIGNVLIDMYIKLDLISISEEVFRSLPVRNQVSWNTLVSGYTDHGQTEYATRCFEKMQLEGILPDAITLICCLSAYGDVEDTDKGLEVHAEIERQGLLEHDILVGNALIDMYARCGELSKAQEVFNSLQFHDVVSWNALISGYAEYGHSKEALEHFEQMQHEAISPSAITMIYSLNAYVSIGAITKAQEIHAEAERQGLLKTDVVVGNALVNVYAKSGLIDAAHEVYNKLPIQNVVSRTALMTGYGHIGECEQVFFIFESMLEDNIKPDQIAFVVVLNACSRAGLFLVSETYFEAMSKEHGLVPTLQHHACMIDLLGREGQLDKAMAMIQKIPTCPNAVVWQSFMGACKMWGNVQYAQQAFNQARSLDPNDAVAYFLMSQTYASTELQNNERVIDLI